MSDTDGSPKGRDGAAGSTPLGARAGAATAASPNRGGVDSSPEAIAYHLKLLSDCHTARLLAQVARERDAALGSLGYYSDEARQEAIDAYRDMRCRADAAERQLAEARAALEPLEEGYRNRCNYCHGEIKYCDPRPECPAPKARALLSGETTRVEDKG